MPYLLTEILLCLLLAFLIGVLVGWLIKRWSCRSEHETLRAELKGQGDEITSLRARLASCEEGQASSSGGDDSQKMGIAAAALASIPAATRKDDLKLIWGIGPKMESLLNGVGIQSFEQVAGASIDRLRDIIAAYGTKRLTDIANEETWPQQARMAADDDWDGLKAYQKTLSWKKGGRPDPS